MHLCKILLLIGVALVCINARALKRQKKVRQKRPTVTTSCSRTTLIETPCSCKSILEPTYGSLGACSCPNIMLNEVPEYGCGCLSIWNTDVPNYSRVPAINLPKVIANCDTPVPIPAINLPGLYDYVNVPSCPTIPYELPCQCKPTAYQCVEGPCSCRMQLPILEYIPPVDVSCSILKAPYIEPYYIQMPKCNCQPQVIELPSCGCPLPKVDCGCQNVNMPYAYPNLIGTPCGCDYCLSSRCNCQPQIMELPPCGCPLPTVDCGCQNVNMPCAYPNLIGTPCGCDYCLSSRCNCQPQIMELPPCGCPLPTVDCGCQNVNMPCAYPNLIGTPCGCDYCLSSRCNCQPQIMELPSCGCPLPIIECGCQNVNIPYAYQNVINSPCGYENCIKMSYGLPYNCENALTCECQNAQYGRQLPALSVPCGCKSCQLPSGELPFYGYDCQCLAPSVNCCGGNYLRQVALQPPFL